MGRHIVKKNGFKYIFQDDKTYELYINGKAYFDKSQDFRNKSDNKFCKGPKPIVKVDISPVVVMSPKEEHSIADAIKVALTEVAHEKIDEFSNWVTNKGIPYLWHNKIIPAYKAQKEYKKRGCKLKYEEIIEQRKNRGTEIATRPTQERKQSNAKPPMTEEEILQEQKKIIFHYIGLLQSLTKLNDAGVIDKNLTLKQLMNPDTIELINRTISTNPNILEMTQYNEFSQLLERDLFQSGNYIPIEIEEIKILVSSKTED